MKKDLRLVNPLIEDLKGLYQGSISEEEVEKAIYTGKVDDLMHKLKTNLNMLDKKN